MYWRFKKLRNPVQAMTLKFLKIRPCHSMKIVLPVPLPCFQSLHFTASSEILSFPFLFQTSFNWAPAKHTKFIKILTQSLLVASANVVRPERFWYTSFTWPQGSTKGGGGDFHCSVIAPSKRECTKAMSMAITALPDVAKLLSVAAAGFLGWFLQSLGITCAGFFDDLWMMPHTGFTDVLSKIDG